MSDTDRSELAAAVIAAVNSRDPGALSALLAPEAEVRTGRSVKSGPDAVLEWAAKAYDHLDRRYAVEVARGDGDRVLLIGDVQYVWRDGGEVGDSTPIALTLAFEGDLLRSLRVEDDPETALAEFES